MSTVVTGKKRSGQPNRRKSKRSCIYTRYAVLVYTAEEWKDGGRPAIGILTDIGNEGLGIIMDSSIASGTKVLLIVHPTKAQERQLAGSVIWINPLPSANRIIKETEGATSFFRVGIRLDPENSEQNQYIQELLQGLRETVD